MTDEPQPVTFRVRCLVRRTLFADVEKALESVIGASTQSRDHREAFTPPETASSSNPWWKATYDFSPVSKQQADVVRRMVSRTGAAVDRRKMCPYSLLFSIDSTISVNEASCCLKDVLLEEVGEYVTLSRTDLEALHQEVSNLQSLLATSHAKVEEQLRTIDRLREEGVRERDSHRTVVQDHHTVVELLRNQIEASKGALSRA